MKHIKGDLIKLAQQGHFDVIVHGCNCFHTMGGGIALTIKNTFPDAYQADLKTPYQDAEKLGTYSKADIVSKHTVHLSLSEERGLTIEPKVLTVVNAYTQYDFGSHRNPCPVDYQAIRRVFRAIAKDFAGKRVGIPAIGCGLAGGDWNIVEQIIDEECPDLDVTYVEFVPQR